MESLEQILYMWKTFKDIDTKKSENQIEHMREQQSYIFREERQHHDSTFYKEQNILVG